MDHSSFQSTSQINMVVAGGYYNGRHTMAFPLTSLIAPDHPWPTSDYQWRRLDYLPEERQWGPAVGLVGGELTISAGKNYGDTTMDTIENDHYWNRDRQRELRHKREFVVGLTVPHTWFPSFCGFN